MEERAHMLTLWWLLERNCILLHYWLEYVDLLDQQWVDLLEILHALALRDAECHDSNCLDAAQHGFGAQRKRQQQCGRNFSNSSALEPLANLLLQELAGATNNAVRTLVWRMCQTSGCNTLSSRFRNVAAVRPCSVATAVAPC